MDKIIIHIYTNNRLLDWIRYKTNKYFDRNEARKQNRNDLLIKNKSNPDVYIKNSIKYETYSDLSKIYSAFKTLSTSQAVVLISIVIAFVTLLLLRPLLSLQLVIGALSIIYFIDFLFTLFIIYRSFSDSSAIKISNDEIAQINDNLLPKYTILVPLYKEWEVIEQFTNAIEIIDWPKNKIEVILLLEEGDIKTINKAYDLKLPSYFKIEIVPDSLPKTKPKACNYGLLKATGEYTVVYDAEDKPDPLQLKKSYLAFQKVPKNVVCLQSKLNYYNQNQNLLTKLFTAEYSYWFDVALPGLQTLNTIIPLGGTSNHFKTSVLKKLQGWDPFNVTEDCDLGTRLFKEGYRTSIVDSETLEEANSNLKSWIKQRSRWIKGYMQTYLVHMRNPIEFFSKFRFHALLFQLIIGMRMVFMIINPILWLMTISYFTLYHFVGPFIESLYPWYIFYPAVFCLIFANFTYFYSYMIALAKKDKWDLIGYVFLVPFYWLLASYSSGIAFYQLITNPYYWEKTKHGLHLGAKEKTRRYIRIPKISIIPTFDLPKFEIQPIKVWERVKSFTKNNAHKIALGGGVLVLANLFANFSNYLFSAILGRNLSYEDFGETSLVTNLQLILSVITGSIFASVSYKSAVLLGKRGGMRKDIWRKFRKNSFYIFLPISIILLELSYLNYQKFGIFNDLMIFSAVSISFLFSAVSAVDGGFLSGNLKFIYMALLISLSSIIRFIVGYFGLLTDNLTIIFFSQTVAIIISLLVGWIFISKMKEEKTKIRVKVKSNFPRKFYLSSVMNRFSIAFFLSADVILAKVFLSDIEAGKYAILSLIGKSIYFLGSLIPQFITPMIGKEVGEGNDGLGMFYKILSTTILITGFTFIILGVYPQIFAVALFGNKVYQILPFVTRYALAISAFTIASTIAIYHQTRKQYIFTYLGFILSFFEIIYLAIFHSDIGAIVNSISLISFSYLLSAAILHLAMTKSTSLKVNVISFLKLFNRLRVSKPVGGNANILIFNWRDTRHIWGGGAEVYIQELAQRWIKKGYGVTIFCGNDGESRFDETIQKVRVIRRGGFFTLYIWASIYYLFKFRSKFDFILDCENGVPFFAPLYSGLPKILLIHHVHQQVFRENLPFPLNNIAMFLESQVMRTVYKNVKITTISESSKKDILNLGLGNKEDINIVNPGINLKGYYKMNKYDNPTFCYLGRLMPYKNVDVLIKSFAGVLEAIPKAKLIIAGKGPSEGDLMNIAKKLGIANSVEFKGYVTEIEKREILARSWVLVQPSSFEGWGITVIEANASHTPVIASNTAGLRDSVVDGQTGILVKTGSEKELTRSMIALSEMDGYRKRLSVNAYKWSRNFSWNVLSYTFLNIVDGEIKNKQKTVSPAYTYTEQ